MADTLTKELIKEICATGDKTETIPATTESGSNALSYAEGFPIATATPQSDGGIPPKRTDMNKVLNVLSKNQVFLQNGGKYSYDSTIATGIGGYPKGARLLYTDVGGQKYNIESLIDNNTTAPTSSNIYTISKIQKAEGIVSATSPDLPTASEDKVGQIYLIQAVSSTTKPVGTKAYVCVAGGGSYTWTEFNVSDLFDSQDTIFVNSTKEYYAIIYTSFCAIGYDGLTDYKWIYIPTAPTTSEVSRYGITAYAIEHLQTGTKDTVYHTTKPTLVICGLDERHSNWNFTLQVSTDQTNWVTVGGYSVSSGDPASTSKINQIIDKDVYWKMTCSRTDYTLKYSSLY